MQTDGKPDHTGFGGAEALKQAQSDRAKAEAILPVARRAGQRITEEVNEFADLLEDYAHKLREAARGYQDDERSHNG